MLKRMRFLLAAALLLLTGSATFGQAGQIASEAPVQLRVQLGRSLVVSLEEPLQRVSVTDAAVASAVIVSPMQVLIHGQQIGTVTLILWDEQEQTRSFNLTVEMDINAIRQAVTGLFPDEAINVSQSGNAAVLTGSVSSPEVVERAGAVAATHAENVVNMLQALEGREIVMLQVRFAEVNRAALSQLGLNLISTGAVNTIGTTSTQQFAPPTLDQAGTDAAVVFNLSDLMNIFLFRPDIDLAATIRALQQQNLLQILAEPNVMALNGREASFLAGGEFPFPVVQSAAAGTAVTIQFREFGIRLNFTPQVLPDGLIRLKVVPEVSALDFANALTISGFLIPALSTRRAETEVELREGQSFAIAGLIDNRLTEAASKIPVLGDIPILGYLFRSRARTVTNTELLVLITPQLVQPMDAPDLPPGPAFPKPFLDIDRFDGPAGGTPAPQGAIPPAGAPAAAAASSR